MSENEVLAWRIVGWIIVIGIVPGIYLVVRAFLRTPEQKFRKVYHGIPLYSTPAPDTVFIRFHTYDGFVVWFTQTTHEGYTTPEFARLLLRRLDRYNIIHGLFAAGALLIPIVSYFNYRAQLRSVAAQEADMAAGVVQMELSSEMGLGGPQTSPGALAVTPKKSKFRVAIGWLAATLCLVFAACAVAFLVQQKYEESVGGIIVCVLFGSVARDWLRGIPD
jgi:hypothetical protein